VHPSPAPHPCLSRLMQSAGHSLDWGCRLCVAACGYAAPCGCGAGDCVDLVLAAPRSRVAAAA